MKKLIENYIEKWLAKKGRAKVFGRRTPYTKYLFARWVVELFSDKNKMKDAIFSISYYVYITNLKLTFTDIFVVGNTVYVFTERPGFWIGKGGQTYDEIVKKLNFNINGEQIANYKLELVEDRKSPNFEFSSSLSSYYHIYGEENEF